MKTLLLTLAVIAGIGILLLSQVLVSIDTAISGVELPESKEFLEPGGPDTDDKIPLPAPEPEGDDELRVPRGGGR